MSSALSAVARGQRALPRIIYAMLGIGIIGIVGLMFYWAYLMPNPPKVVKPDESQQASVANFDWGAPMHESNAAPAAPTTPAPPPPPHDEPAAKVDEGLAPPPAAVPTVTPMTVWVRPNAEELLKKVSLKPAGGGDDDDAGGGGTDSKSAYGQSVQSTKISDTRPKFRRFPPAFTLQKGDPIFCTPPMPIDTQIPGPLWCSVDAPVMSMNKENTLIPNGSRINLQLERGLGLGQDRAVILATDVQTTGPFYLSIDLDAITASSAGQNGVPVDVHEHTWERVKQAAIAALIEGVASAGSSALSSGGNQYIGGFGQQSQSVASIFAQHDVDIPRTGYRGAGRQITVYMNHNIDLSNYYENALAHR